MLLLQLRTDMLGEGILYTAIGFSVVLIVLLLITFVLYIFSAIVNLGNGKKQEEPKEVPTPAEAPAVAAAESGEAPMPQPDDTELIAVITAAVAASLNTTSDKLVVRSIRKVNSWKKESIRQKNNALF